VTDGVFVVDKPAGATSHTVVAQLRRRLGTRAIGHAGTLDPMATGVLLLLVGEATKLSSYLTLETKAYRAEVLFGVATDTLDIEGKRLEERAVGPDDLDEHALRVALGDEQQRTLQVPPAVSAIQIGGERAYRLARRGIAPELPARPVHVHSLELLAFRPPRAELEVRVSKGYYVRSLARDLGERLGLPACLSALRRTESGAFSLTEAWPWPLPDAAEPLSLVAAARRCLPVAVLTAEGLRKTRCGQALSLEHFSLPPDREGPYAWLDGADVVAIGSRQGDEYRVLRGFRTPDAVT
jgi:tRNA pseudouridine55 synthase